jgi:hypothetical protein
MRPGRKYDAAYDRYWNLVNWRIGELVNEFTDSPTRQFTKSL